MPRVTANDVANYILLSVDEESGDNISNLKLQKLVYYCQGFHLAVTGRPLFEESIHAWAHGPVVPSLYYCYSSHKAGAIPRPENANLDSLSGESREIIDEVLRVYGQFSAWKLRDMTHEERPWKETPPNGIISQDSMRDFFKTLVVSD